MFMALTLASKVEALLNNASIFSEVGYNHHYNVRLSEQDISVINSVNSHAQNANFHRV